MQASVLRMRVHDMRRASVWRGLRGCVCLQQLTCEMNHLQMIPSFSYPTAQRTFSAAKPNACGKIRVLRTDTESRDYIQQELVQQPIRTWRSLD